MAKTSIGGSLWKLTKLSVLSTILGSAIAFLLGFVMTPIQMAFAPLAYLIMALLLAFGVWMLKADVLKAFTWLNTFVVTLLMMTVAGVISLIPSLASYVAWVNMATPLSWVQMFIYAFLGLAALGKLYPKALNW